MVAYIDFTKEILKLEIDGENYTLKLVAEIGGNFWDSIIHKGITYDIYLRMNSLDNLQYVVIYETDKGSTLISTEQEIEIKSVKGSAFKFLYPHYKQTDGSLETLQYAYKVSTTSWVYYELGGLYNSIQEAEKDLGNWEGTLLTITDFTVEDIKEVISSYGYKLEVFGNNLLEVRLEGYNQDDSIQLILECISENNS